MNCPVCREPMIVLEYDQVEIDHCVSCKGIWLDRGELELLLDNGEEGKHLLSSFQGEPNPKEKPRTCPICSKKMEVVLCEDVQIDRCQAGDGLWFDLGELECIFRLSGLGGNTKVLEWLKHIFAKAV
ncbi:MAG: zf-TFIIB domain-containing protein [Candidatus Omnitrophica bacterium]|nr:zf-TFIIB domain-containing protein [Candidatus Omnitrophota bacterium]